MSTPPSSGHPPATPYDSYLKMLYLDVFVLELNTAFTHQLSLADEGYESGSNNDLPTPLCKTPCIHHILSLEHASFNPTYTTPHCTADPPHYDTHLTSPRPVRCCLMFLSDSSESDQDPDSSSDNDQDPGSSSDEGEDFQTVPIDDDHWTAEMVPERTFCIHENGLPNNVCQYIHSNDSISYMDSLDLSDISDYEDYMLTTSNDEELPGLEEVPY